jgi:hypothetical protein
VVTKTIRHIRVGKLQIEKISFTLLETISSSVKKILSHLLPFYYDAKLELTYQEQRPSVPCAFIQINKRGT